MTPYTRREWTVVLVLAVGIFTSILSYYLVTPFLGLISQQFGLSEATVGQLSTAQALTGAIVGVIAAPLMDVYQRRRLIQFGLVTTGLSTVGAAIAPTFGLLLVARALAGLGSVFVTACCYASASDVFADADQRNRCVGIMFSAAGVSAIVGIPVLTQLSALANWQWAVATLLLPTTLVLLGTTLLPQRALATKDGALLRNYLRDYHHVLRNAEVKWLLVASTLRFLVWNVPLIYSVSIWVGMYQLSLRNYGWLFAVAGTVFFAGSNLASPLLHRFSAGRLFVAGVAVQCVAGIIFGLVGYNLSLALILFCGPISLMAAFLGVVLNVLLQDVLPESRGAVLSLSGTTGSIGTAVAGALGGLLLATLGTASLVPLTSLLIPLAGLACWLGVRRVTLAAVTEAEPAGELAD